MNQQFENHRRYVLGFHVATFGLIAIGLVGSIINLVNSVHDHGNLYSASLIVLIHIILALVAFYARAFALKAQDRAIRAEENLRHFALTGNLHQPGLTLSQIIALRFADDDEEFLELSKHAAVNNLKASEIKKQIQRWKADHHRV